MPSRFSLRACLFLLLSLPCLIAHAQRTAPVVMLSDIHFDPFHDPAKLQGLRTAPVEGWAGILAAPPSPTQAADLQALQADCHTRALDTAWPLLKTSLIAAHDAEPHPTFLTVSGDLLAHDFPCRFAHLAPGSTPEDLSAFAAKTVAFVLLQIRGGFPRVPVYGALGNNDSGCEDYRETAGDTYLKNTAASLALAAGNRAGNGPGSNPDSNQGHNPANATPEGDYSVLLPAPIVHTRLIVLQDIFEGRQFNTCAAAADRAPQKAQIDWLRTQLAEARAQNQHVWLMAHMPTGVDAYTSFRRYLLQPAGLCSAEPRPFLADTSLADALLDYADIVRLTLFGHTHMDEFRLLRRAGSGATIPAKLVPSVTPFFGNHPAFLVASVDPRTAVLKDWRTFVSPGPEGSTPPWTEAYRFTTAYGLPDFSAASAAKLADALAADKNGQSVKSTLFRQHFYPGDVGLYALGLAQLWPAYACVVREDRPSAVHDCVCQATPKPQATPEPNDAH